MRDLHVLVVDDDEDFAVSIAELLQMRGMDVETVLDGQQAINRIIANGVDILIMDLHMPKKSGLEVVRELIARGWKVPTIILTAQSDIDQVLLEMKKGSSIKAVLKKPLNPDELLKLVSEISH